MKEIDCTHTDEVVCPYCGYEFQMSYEIFYNPDDDFFRGLECGGVRTTTPIYSTAYDGTKKIKKFDLDFSNNFQ